MYVATCRRRGSRRGNVSRRVARRVSLILLLLLLLLSLPSPSPSLRVRTRTFLQLRIVGLVLLVARDSTSDLRSLRGPFCLLEKSPVYNQPSSLSPLLSSSSQQFEDACVFVCVRATFLPSFSVHPFLFGPFSFARSRLLALSSSPPHFLFVSVGGLFHRQCHRRRYRCRCRCNNDAVTISRILWLYGETARLARRENAIPSRI